MTNIHSNVKTMDPRVIRLRIIEAILATKAARKAVINTTEIIIEASLLAEFTFRGNTGKD